MYLILTSSASLARPSLMAYTLDMGPVWWYLTWGNKQRTGWESIKGILISYYYIHFDIKYSSFIDEIFKIICVCLEIILYQYLKNYFLIHVPSSTAITAPVVGQVCHVKVVWPDRCLTIQHLVPAKCWIYWVLIKWNITTSSHNPYRYIHVIIYLFIQYIKYLVHQNCQTWKLYPHISFNKYTNLFASLH